MSDPTTSTGLAPAGAVGATQADWIARVLGVAVAGAGAAPAAASVDGLEKARADWAATRRKVSASVGALQSKVVDAYAARGLGPKLEAAYQNEVAWVLDALDARVAAALDALISSPDERRRAALLREAREAIGDYLTFVATDKIIDGLDHNPFGVPLALRATLSAALTSLEKALG